MFNIKSFYLTIAIIGSSLNTAPVYAEPDYMTGADDGKIDKGEDDFPQDVDFEYESKKNGKLEQFIIEKINEWSPRQFFYPQSMSGVDGRNDEFTAQTPAGWTVSQNHNFVNVCSPQDPATGDSDCFVAQVIEVSGYASRVVFYKPIVANELFKSGIPEAKEFPGPGAQ